MTLGERIGNLRRDAGYSQEYVAESLGVSRQAVSKWETDLSSPDTENLPKFSDLSMNITKAPLYKAELFV